MEGQLKHYYMDNAKVADYKGYGLSGGGSGVMGGRSRGGNAGTYYGPMDSFRMPGFSIGATQLDPMSRGAGADQRMPIGACGGVCGCPTCSGHGVISYPMGGGLSGGMYSGGAYSGGMASGGAFAGRGLSGGADGVYEGAFGEGMKRCAPVGKQGRCVQKHSQARILAGRRAAAANPWIKKVKEFAANNGVSYKQAMTALGKK